MPDHSHCIPGRSTKGRHRHGLAWSAERVVAEDGTNGLCYPTMVQRADGKLLVFCSRTPEIISPCDQVMLGPFAP